MKKSVYFTSSILFGFLLLSGCAGLVSKDTTLDVNYIDAAVAEAMKDGKLPALAVQIIKENEKFYFKTIGKRSIQNSAEVKYFDKWHLGSDTKAMTAFLVALAVQDGKIKYESKLSDIWGKRINFHKLNKNLTIADILTHGSGLHDLQQIKGGKLWKSLSQSKKSLVQQRFEISKAALEEPPFADKKNSAAPNRSFSYANINYIIAGAILEKIYTDTWENQITKKIFEPLKIRNCGFGVAGIVTETEPTQPWPHVIENNQLIGVPPKYKLDNPPLIGPAGSVHCSLDEWKKFIDELTRTWHRSGQFLKDDKIIEKYFSAKADNIYTLAGWGRNDDKFKTPTFQHNGSNTFNYAVAFFAPQKQAAVFLATNSGQPEVEPAMQKLKKKLTEALMADAEDKDVTDKKNLTEKLQSSSETAKLKFGKEKYEILTESVDEVKKLRIEDKALKAGKKIPNFALPDVSRGTVQASELLKKGSLVIVFYRGSWCPYCNLQLRDLQKNLKLIHEAGAELVAISPQLPDNSLLAVNKNNLEFYVLSDVGNKVAGEFGLVYKMPEKLKKFYIETNLNLERINGNKEWDLPVSATYVVKKTGEIYYTFIDADYKVRPETKEILKILERMNKENN